MITIKNAQISSINNGLEMAYTIEYSDGTNVRAVVSKDQFIRKEYKVDNNWRQLGKAYKVEHNKKRQAEKIIEIVQAWLV